MMERLFLNLLEVSLAAGLVIAILLLLTPVINKRFAARWKYCLWLLIAVRLLVPFSISWADIPLPSGMGQPSAFIIPVPDIGLNINMPRPTPTIDAATDATAPVAAVNQPVSTAAAAPLAAATLPLTLVEAAALIWLLGVFMMLLYQFMSYHLCRRQLLRWSYPVSDPDIKDARDELSVAMGIKKPVALCVSRRISSPMLIGFLRPVLLLPREDYDAAAAHFILKHELIHFKRRDVWYKLLLQAARAVHWFNPLVWLMLRGANADLERYCDDAVVAGAAMEERRRYNETILAAVQPQPYRQTALSTYFYGGMKGMKERFRNILHPGPRRRGIAAFCAVMLALALLGGMIACGGDEEGNIADRYHTTDEVVKTLKAYGVKFTPDKQNPATEEESLLGISPAVYRLKGDDNASRHLIYEFADLEQRNAALESIGKSSYSIDHNNFGADDLDGYLTKRDAADNILIVSCWPSDIREGAVVTDEELAAYLEWHEAVLAAWQNIRYAFFDLNDATLRRYEGAGADWSGCTKSFIYYYRYHLFGTKSVMDGYYRYDGELKYSGAEELTGYFEYRISCGSGSMGHGTDNVEEEMQWQDGMVAFADAQRGRLVAADRPIKITVNYNGREENFDLVCVSEEPFSPEALKRMLQADAPEEEPAA
ncbi:MAG: M56 family metallopeptidase [Syntrophomonadaceae bacterium]|nr:M56 family metallopeptidase [Syntrophomonadaceae bacterium]